MRSRVTPAAKYISKRLPSANSIKKKVVPSSQSLKVIVPSFLLQSPISAPPLQIHSSNSSSTR